MRRKMTTTCPHCAYVNTGIAASAKEYDDRPPERGDVVVCIQCEEPALFLDGNGSLRKPTPEEAVQLLSDVGLMSCRQAIREARKSGIVKAPKKKEPECIYLGPPVKV